MTARKPIAVGDRVMYIGIDRSGPAFRAHGTVDEISNERLFAVRFGDLRWWCNHLELRRLPSRPKKKHHALVVDPLPDSRRSDSEEPLS